VNHVAVVVNAVQREKDPKGRKHQQQEEAAKYLLCRKKKRAEENMCEVTTHFAF